jgi:hypothetical protein
MVWSDVVQKWKDLVDTANSKGIPMPMVRDPKSGLGSITATLVVVSSGLCAISILMMLAVFLSKMTAFFTLNDATFNIMKEAFSSSMQFFIAAIGAYLGRKMQKTGNDVVLEKEEK